MANGCRRVWLLAGSGSAKRMAMEQKSISACVVVKKKVWQAKINLLARMLVVCRSWRTTGRNMEEASFLPASSKIHRCSFIGHYFFNTLLPLKWFDKHHHAAAAWLKRLWLKNLSFMIQSTVHENIFLRISVFGESQQDIYKNQKYSHKKIK